MRRLIVFVSCCLVTAATARQQQAGCRVTYALLRLPVERASAAGGFNNASEALPLLLGGIHGRCTSGCAPRDSKWADACRFNSSREGRTWGVCEPQQRPALIALAASLSGGDPLSFTPCELNQQLRGRTLWLIGDSHIKNLYWALRCFMMDLWDTRLGECAAAADPATQLALHSASLYRARQAALWQITEPRCITLLEGGRICLLHTVRGENIVSGNTSAPGLLELLQAQGLAARHDVFYTSFGRWYQHGCTHFEQERFEAALTGLARWFTANKASWPNLLYTVPPFDHSSCAPTFNAAREPHCPVAGNGSSLEVSAKLGTIAHDLLGRAGVRIIDLFQLSVPLHMAHVSKIRSFQAKLDCLHFCRPGLPEIELWHLHDALKAMQLAPVQPQAAPTGEPARRCAAIEQIY